MQGTYEPRWALLVVSLLLSPALAGLLAGYICGRILGRLGYREVIPVS